MRKIQESSEDEMIALFLQKLIPSELDVLPGTSERETRGGSHTGKGSIAMKSGWQCRE